MESISQVSHLASTLVSSGSDQQAIASDDEELRDAILAWSSNFWAHLVECVKQGSLTSALVEASNHAETMMTDAKMCFTPVASHPDLKAKSVALEKLLQKALAVQEALQSLRDMSATEPVSGQLRVLHTLHSAVHSFRQLQTEAEKGELTDFYLAVEDTAREVTCKSNLTSPS